MAYIGRGTENISNVEVLDNLTFDGSASYTLQKSSTNFVPSSANNLLISISGVVQQGNFSVSGSTITFDTTVSASDTCDWILHYGTGLITTVADGAITEAKLGNGAVTNTKLANSSLTINSQSISLGGTATIPTGKIAQIVQSDTGTQTSINTSSMVDTTITADITPSATSSKIFVIATIQYISFTGTSNNVVSFLKCQRNTSTQIGGYIMGRQDGYVGEDGGTMIFTDVDSPNTTSSTNYKIYAMLNTAGDGRNLKLQPYIGGVTSISKMTLMEVLA